MEKRLAEQDISNMITTALSECTSLNVVLAIVLNELDKNYGPTWRGALVESADNILVASANLHLAVQVSYNKTFVFWQQIPQKK